LNNRQKAFSGTVFDNLHQDLSIARKKAEYECLAGSAAVSLPRCGFAYGGGLFCFCRFWCKAAMRCGLFYSTPALRHKGWRSFRSENLNYYMMARC